MDMEVSDQNSPGQTVENSKHSTLRRLHLGSRVGMPSLSLLSCVGRGIATISTAIHGAFHIFEY
jgi:hypothetical protein